MKIVTEMVVRDVMEAYEGKTIEQRCREMVETGEPIKDTSPLIYTPKEKGVRPEYNVRADMKQGWHSREQD